MFIPSPNIDGVLAAAIEADLVKAGRTIISNAADVWPNDTGHYDQSLRVKVDERGVVVQTDDPAGHIIEWGSARHQPQAPLRTAAADAGRFEPK
jgi:hypothetical protein